MCSKSKTIIRRIDKYNNSPSKLPPTKKNNEVKHISIPAAPVSINRNMQHANISIKPQDTHVKTIPLIVVEMVLDQLLSLLVYLFVILLLQGLGKKTKKINVSTLPN